MTTNVTAKPVCQTSTRGFRARPTAKTAQPMTHQPSRWCRKAERWKNQPFCSWTSSAVPETTNASGVVSRQCGFLSLPRTSPSSAPPHNIITWAHEPWASVWMAEFVKKTITGHIITPMKNARPGQRYGRHARRAQTSGPTSASANRQSPSMRKPVANIQWTISDLGCIEILDQARRNEAGKEQADGQHPDRRLGDEPPKTLA